MAERNPLGFGRSGNPALTDAAFRGLAGTGEGVMTLEGTVHKTGLSLLIVGAAGGVGSILVQLARRLTRATVVGTASRAELQPLVHLLVGDWMPTSRS